MKAASIVIGGLVVAGLGLAAGACAKAEQLMGGSESGEPEAAAAEREEPVAMKSLAGTWSFQDGEVTFTQEGARATGSYTNGGKLDCLWNGVKQYDCAWSDQSGAGKAAIWWYRDYPIGNWGWNDKADGGGMWDFREPGHRWVSDGPSATSGDDTSAGAKSCTYNNQCHGVGPGTTTRCYKSQCVSSIGTPCSTNSDCGFEVRGTQCANKVCVDPD